MRTQFSKLALTAIVGIALAFTLSCSSSIDLGDGGGISFSEDPQVYNTYWAERNGGGRFLHIGDAYTGSGVIEMASEVGCSSSDGCYWDGYGLRAGKVACDFNSSEGKRYIYNIDAKVGWNKVYSHDNRTTKTIEASTDNILTKEVKWMLRNWE